MHAAAKPAADCVATVLPFPPGMPTGSRTDVTKADDTGRYVVGRVLSDEGTWPVLWADGVARLLEDAPGSDASVVDVNSSGTVLGVSLAKDGTTLPWVFANGVYKELVQPDYMGGTTSPTAINNRGDVVGAGMSTVTDAPASLLWPAGGPARVLYTPDDEPSFVTDINDAGVVIGSTKIIINGRDYDIGIRWTDWTQEGERVYGQDKSISQLTEIRGNYTGGNQRSLDTGLFGGLIWDDLRERFHSVPTATGVLNNSGDAVASTDEGEDVVVAFDGTKRWVFPERTRIATLMDRTRALGPQAAGTNGGFNAERAVLWHGCNDAMR